MIETERCLICEHDRRDHEYGLACLRCECIEYVEMTWETATPPGAEPDGA